MSIQKVYCGPNILKYGMLRYQVFIGEDYPYNVKEAIEAIPELGHLFCEVDELDNTRKAIKESGTALNVYYSEVLKKLS